MHVLANILKEHNHSFASVVPFNEAKENAVRLDLSASNKALHADIFNNTGAFSAYINQLLQDADARFGVGGYLENRKVYARSAVFDGSGSEARSLHLGVDIWGAAGTPVYAPLDGMVHSTGFHPAYGNYGGTIIVAHACGGTAFFTLYGHLSRNSLAIAPGTFLGKGKQFAWFGIPEENGYWPPHLHFQIIEDLQGYDGDYPGVCAPSDSAYFAQNCPNPAYLLPSFSKWLL